MLIGPPIRRLASESVRTRDETRFRYLINQDQWDNRGWRLARGLRAVDSDTWTVAFHRVPYNLKSAQDRIFAANLPQRLATRLAAGR